MKTTKELARELGIIRKRYISTSLAGDSSNSKKQKICSGQIFSYLVVLDFESTCWQDGKFRTQEIIEFPAVLCNTKTGLIESEFHFYVQPQEQPVLSDFCKQLTGITQDKVEQGIPLSLCLRKFTHWLNQIKKEKNIIFEEGQGARATFVTWSDWDLGVCLLYEARRKQLTRPPEMNSWIDLRATYRKFYGRKPHGLNGALQDVGIEFEGRQHSGLDDARNTARLAWRMMRDGCIMNITKNINTGTVSVSSHEQSVESVVQRKTPGIGKPKIDVLSDGQTESVCRQTPRSHSNSKALRQTKLKPLKENNTMKKQCTLAVNSSKSEEKGRGLIVRDANKIVSTDGSKYFGIDGRRVDCMGKELAQTGSNCSISKLKYQTPSSLNGLGSKPVTPIQSCYKNMVSSSSDVRTPSARESTRNCGNPSAEFKTPNQSLNQRHTKHSSLQTPKPSDCNTAKTFGNGGSCYETPNQSPAQSVFKTPGPMQNGFDTTKLIGSSSMKATPPMCKCGRRSKRRMVQSPGPNLGRFFFTCGVRTSQYDKQRGCDFFQWESPPSGGHNSGRHMSKTGNSRNVSKPFTPVLNMNFASKMSQSKRQLGVRSAVPKFIR